MLVCAHETGLHISYIQAILKPFFTTLLKFFNFVYQIFINLYQNGPFCLPGRLSKAHKDKEREKEREQQREREEGLNGKDDRGKTDRDREREKDRDRDQKKRKHRESSTER